MNKTGNHLTLATRGCRGSQDADSPIPRLTMSLMNGGCSRV